MAGMTWKMKMASRWILPLFCASAFTLSAFAQNFPQLQGDALRSGNAPQTSLSGSLGLVAAIPLTDGVYASPVVADGRAYVIDGSGVVFAIDVKSNKVVWRRATKGGAGNCNNVAAPAVVGEYLHVGTTAGYYYVLNRSDGSVVTVIDCEEPIFSAPAAGNGRAYFATLGARIYAVEPDGKVAWTWDFVKEVVGFKGNRWLGSTTLFVPAIFAWSARPSSCRQAAERFSSMTRERDRSCARLRRFRPTRARSSRRPSVKARTPMGTSTFNGIVVTTPAASKR